MKKLTYKQSKEAINSNPDSVTTLPALQSVHRIKGNINLGLFWYCEYKLKHTTLKGQYFCAAYKPKTK